MLLILISYIGLTPIRYIYISADYSSLTNYSNVNATPTTEIDSQN